MHGVGFAIKNALLKHLETPVGLSSRLMKLRICTAAGAACLFSAYAPTMQATDEEKDSFYTLLESEVVKAKSCEALIVLGDFNARVGRDWESWPGCIGKEGVGNMNENGQRVLELCASQQLCVTNTYFAGKLSHKTTWQHPRSRHWHQLDLVLCRRALLKEVLHTRAFHSAVAGSDHCLVICKLRISAKRLHRGKPGRKKVDRDSIKDPSKAASFINAMNSAAGVESDWDKLCALIHQQALKHFGSQVRKRNDWFDDEVLLPLVEAKRAALLKAERAPTRQNKNALRVASAELQKGARRCANEYWLNLAEMIQTSADMGNLRDMYGGIKTAVGSKKKRSAPLKDLDGNLLTDKSDQLRRWTEHYSGLYGSDSQVDMAAIEEIPDVEQLLELDAVPTMDDLEAAITNLSNNKATGSDGLPAEVLKLFAKVGSPVMLDLHAMIVSFWRNQEVPQSLKDCQFTQLYKNKGDMSDCNNYRGISLLSVFGKAIARILLKRLQVLGEKVYPESQCGFRASRSTMDMVFTLRLLQEKCREKRVPLFTAFVDLAKAFDTVSREGLFRVLQKIGCPPTLLSVIRSLHDGMEARVSFDGDVSASFPVNRGVKQGCVLAPCLFNIYFSCLLRHAFSNNKLGVYMHTRYDGGLFNVRRFGAKTKVSPTTITDLLFADDAALVAHSADELQELLNKFAASCAAFGLLVSNSKTVVMCQEPVVSEVPHVFSVNGKELKCVDEFCYLGATVTNKVSLETDLNRRIGKAAGCFGQLQKRVWKNQKLRLGTKVAVYKACVLSVLLYGSETWSAYALQLNRLNTFHQRCLRKILGVQWSDRVSNTEVLEKCGVSSMHTILTERRLRWFGHVCRMEQGRLPRTVMYSEVVDGARPHGRPLLRFGDRVRDDLRYCEVAEKDMEIAVRDRAGWRRTVRIGAAAAEASWQDAGFSRRKRTQKH